MAYICVCFLSSIVWCTSKAIETLRSYTPSVWFSFSTSVKKKKNICKWKKTENATKEVKVSNAKTQFKKEW